MPAQGPVYILLDEVQEVRDWEKLVNSLIADGRFDIYITGSNSRLLSGELSTYIAGRCIQRMSCRSPLRNDFSLFNVARTRIVI